MIFKWIIDKNILHFEVSFKPRASKSGDSKDCGRIRIQRLKKKTNSVTIYFTNRLFLIS